ncbi:MAG TPA: hypothetical protein PLU93_10940, partial [Treponemataceae bacterium]|nr:hypothetical protein [Treponemataceae bacterium]
YEKLAPSVKNKSPMVASIIRIASNYNYFTPVRTRPYEVLKPVSGNGQKNGDDKKSADKGQAKAN